MFYILSWLIYGLIVGLLAKAIHRGPDPIGFLPTILIGIAGSYIGGFINWMIGRGHSMFEPSGIIMGILGGVLFCFAYAKYKDYNAGKTND